MPTITLSNLKGGTGKSTTAIYLATALTNGDRPAQVTVYDLDPQGSATTWSGYAEDDGTPLPFKVSPTNTYLLSRLKATPNEWIILDCPPGAGTAVDAAIDAADLVIVPLTPSGIEADRMWSTVEVAQARGAKAQVLLTSVMPRTKAARAIITALDDDEVPRFQTTIPQREDIKNSWGQYPQALHGYDDLATEVIALIGTDTRR